MRWNAFFSELKENWSFKNLKRLFLENDFLMPFRDWGKVKYVLPSILFASFLINLLSLIFPLTILQVYDRIIPNNAMETLLFLVIGVSVALILETILKITRSYVSTWADTKLEHAASYSAFSCLVKSSLAEFEKAGSGAHLKRLNALNQLRDFYSGQAIVSIADMPFIVLLLLLIAYIGTWLVLVPIFMLFLYIASALLQTKDLQKILEMREGEDDRRLNFIIEVLSNIHTVKSSNMEALMMRRYERLQKTSALNDYDVISKGSSSMILGISMSQITIIAVVAIGSIMVIKGFLTVGGLAACTLLSGRVLQPANNLVKVWVRLKTVEIARNEIKKIFTLPSESNPSLPSIGKISGEIHFSNVSFNYDKANQKSILKKINLIIKPRESIAIVGKGSMGKSTLFWLLMGILKPNEGEILIDQKNINTVNLDGLRKQIAYLPQESVLFDGTIMENITMFQEKEYYDQAKKISSQLGLDKIVENFPNGYDTVVAHQSIDSVPRGVSQRIGIARALLNDPPIVFFDEANMSLDRQGDERLKQILSEYIGKKTMIIVSHRPSILTLAEKRYVLDNGMLNLA